MQLFVTCTKHATHSHGLVIVLDDYAAGSLSNIIVYTHD